AAPKEEGRLLREAGGSLHALREACARAKAHVVNREERRRQIHAARGVHDFVDPDGVWVLTGRNNPEVGAQLMAALAPRRDVLFEAARRDGRKVTLAACAMDALVEAVCESRPDAVPTRQKQREAIAKIFVRIDLDALL